MSQLIRIPWKFYLDHYERGLPTPENVRSTKSHVYINANDPHINALWADAEFYAHQFGPDLVPSIKTSATTTLTALNKVLDRSK